MLTCFTQLLRVFPLAILLASLMACGKAADFVRPLNPNDVPRLASGQSASWGRIESEAANCEKRYIGEYYRSMIIRGGNGPFFDTSPEGGPTTRSYYLYYYNGLPFYGLVELKQVEYRMTLDEQNVVRECKAWARDIKQEVLDGTLKKTDIPPTPLPDDDLMPPSSAPHKTEVYDPELDKKADLSLTKNTPAQP